MTPEIKSFFFEILVISIVIVLATAFPFLLPHIVKFLFQSFSCSSDAGLLFSNFILGYDQGLDRVHGVRRGGRRRNREGKEVEEKEGGKGGGRSRMGRR